MRNLGTVKRKCVVVLAALFGLVATGWTQDREALVRQDIERFSNDDRWVYNDFDRARRLARQTGKPMLVVFRCVPCEACSEFDKHVLDREEELGDLLDRFVCTRLIHMNGLDLSLFQFDFDQSLHILFMNADNVIYGRFGTRSHRPESQDMTLLGLRRAMERALAWHAEYPNNRVLFESKRATDVTVTRPEEYPTLRNRYRSVLDYAGKIVPSCIHCHQVREAERIAARQSAHPLPEKLLYPYPLPDVIGLQMDPDQCARVTRVEPNSPAARAGLRAGDDIEFLAGQPLLSTADLQWVLHNAPPEARLQGVARRQGERVQFVIELAKGWRQQSDISWRVTTWDLRRLATGGMRLTEASTEQLAEIGLPAGSRALYVQHVGAYGEHATAKQAGFRVGDIIVQIDGQPVPPRETDFIAYALAKPPRTTITAVLRRGNQQLTLSYATR